MGRGQRQGPGRPDRPARRRARRPPRAALARRRGRDRDHRRPRPPARRPPRRRGLGPGPARFSRADTGDELVAEEPAHFWWPGPRLFTATGNGYHRIEQRFEAYAGERIFGLGQHQHGMGNGTRWVADSARQIDYWVTTGEGPRDILHHYADATGHAPLLPEWAAGFWQSKLR